MRGSVGRGVLACCIAWASLFTATAHAEDEFLQLYLQAREYDPTYQRARLERDAAIQGLEEARAGNKPLLQLGLDVSQVYQDIRESDNFLYQVGNSDFLDQSFELSLTQPVYRAETLRRIPQGHADVRRAEATLAAAEQDLMVRLAEAVFSAMAAEDILTFATAERTAIERQVEESEQRLGSGLTTIIDVYDARARYEDAVAREIEARDSVEEARLIIAEIAGSVPPQLGTLGESFPLVDPVPLEADAWVRTAMFQNHRLHAFEEQAEVTRQEMRVQSGARVPTLEFFASYRGSIRGGSEIGLALTDDGPGGSTIFNTVLGLRLGIPIYSGGLVAARTRAAALQHQVTLEDLEREKARLERETRVSFQGVVSGITRVRALQRAVFSQERALESAEEGFRAGLTTGRAVLDSRRDLFSVQRDHSLARYVYALSTLRLKQASGALGVEDMRQVSRHIQ